MGHDHDHEDVLVYFENFDSYYVGWTILILILLALLVCMGYVYVKSTQPCWSIHRRLFHVSWRRRLFHVSWRRKMALV